MVRFVPAGRPDARIWKTMTSPLSVIPHAPCTTPTMRPESARVAPPSVRARIIAKAAAMTLWAMRATLRAGQHKGKVSTRIVSAPRAFDDAEDSAANERLLGGERAGRYDGVPVRLDVGDDERFAMSTTRS